MQETACRKFNQFLALSMVTVAAVEVDDTDFPLWGRAKVLIVTLTHTGMDGRF